VACLHAAKGPGARQGVEPVHGPALASFSTVLHLQADGRATRRGILEIGDSVPDPGATGVSAVGRQLRRGVSGLGRLLGLPAATRDRCRLWTGL